MFFRRPATSSSRTRFEARRITGVVGITAVIAGALTGLGLATDAAPASAAAAPAFECTDPRFFAQAEDPVGTAQLFEGRYNAQGASTWSALGGTKSGASLYNALAFNPVDEYLYGTVYGSTGPGSIVRIDRTGAATNIGLSSPALGNGYSTLWDSGEFDAAGNYYVASGNAGGASQANIRKISGLDAVTSSSSSPRPALSTVTLTPTPRFADLAYKSGFLWAANYGQSATIYRIDVNGVAGAAGTVTSYNVAGVLPVNSYGSAFTMTNGNLAFVATNSHMYQVAVSDPTGTPGFELVNDVAAPTNQRSDAANCSTAPTSSLSVVKTGPATVVVGEPIMWDITVTNDGVGTTSGFVINDSLPAGLTDVKATSTDSACVVMTANAAIICNGGRLLNGETAEVRVTAKAPTTAGVIVNRVKVVGNEDPEPDPATSVPTTVTYATTTNSQFTVPTPNGFGSVPLSTANGGSLSTAGGRLVYTPPVDYSGLDSFSYVTSGGDTVEVVITVRPVAGGDSASTAMGAPVTVTAAAMLANDRGTNISITSVGGATHGSVALVDGDAVFTPAAGYYGPASFTYTLTGDGGTATGTVSVTVIATAPDAVDDTAAASSGVAKTITAATLLANDTSPGTLTVASVTQPGHGTVALNGNGDVVYTSTAGYIGTDTFTYAASGPGGTDTATVTMTVSAVAPAAVDDTADADSGVATTITDDALLANDSGTGIALDSYTQPAHGTVTENATGDLIYTSEEDYSGADGFSYTISGPGGSDTAAVVVTVKPVAPVAVDDEVAASSGVSLAVTTETLFSNDSGTAIGLDGFSQPSHGTLSKNSDGDLVYTSTADYVGTDAFTYTIAGPGGTDTATVTVSVKAVTARADDDSANAWSGRAETLAADTLLGNDEGTSISIDSFTQPSHGTLSENSDGDLVYTSTAGFIGSDSFTYTIVGAEGTDTATVTMTVVAVAPTATDDTVDADSGISTTIDPADLLDNDSGTSIAFDGATQPSHGVVAVLDGKLVYTSEDDYVGTDTFTYTITGPGGSDTATVTVQVKAVAPKAVDDTTSAASGVAKTVTRSELLSTDSGTAIVFDSCTQPSHGRITADMDGELVYTSSEGFVGDDSFEYTISGPGGTDTATVTITVAAVAPTAVDDTASTTSDTAVTITVEDLLADDSGTDISFTSYAQPGHGTVTDDQEGELVYTPAAAYSGTDSFTYTITGTGGTDTAMVTITVTPVAPIAAGDSFETLAGAAKTVPLTQLLRNDTGTAINVATVGAASHGAVTRDPEGGVVYMPATGFSGDDSFEYSVTGPGGDDTATVSIIVRPVAGGGTLVLPSGSQRETDFTDLGEGLAVTAHSDPAHGTVGVVDGALLYTPATGFSGHDSFTYTVTDSAGRTSTATVTVEVTPVAADLDESTAAGTSVTVDPVAHSSGSGLKVVEIVDGPAHGTVAVNADGSVTYTPADGYSGRDSFEYAIRDRDGAAATGTVTIAVTPVADATASSGKAGRLASTGVPVMPGALLAVLLLAAGLVLTRRRRPN